MQTIKTKKTHWTELYDLSSSTFLTFQVLEPGIKTDDKRPALTAENVKDSIEWALRQYDAQCQHCAKVDDDLLPYLDMQTGADIFASALCPEDLKDKSEGSFIHVPKDVLRVRAPRLYESSLAYLFEAADELKSKTSKKTLIKMPGIRSPMDIVSLIWDKNGLLSAIKNEPEAVRELCEMAYELIDGFMEEWKLRYGMEFIAPGADYYMPDGIAFDGDGGGVAEREVFEKFYMPYINRLSDKYGMLGIRCGDGEISNYRDVRGLKMLVADTAFDSGYKALGGVCAGMYSGTDRESCDYLRSHGHSMVIYKSDSMEEAAEKAARIRAEIQPQD